MAITRVQQSQVSGSLSYSDNVPLGSGLAAKQNLADDLNALRALVKDIKGEGSWYEAAAQDLAQIHTAMIAGGVDGKDAEFQQDIHVLRNADVDGTFNADGAATFGSTMDVTGKATLSDELSVAKKATLLDELDVAKAVKLAKSGTQTEVRGDLKVDEGAEIVGDFKADAKVDLSASGKATSVKGTLDVAEGVKLAASGIQTEVRGDLLVDEGAEFADVVDFDDAVYMASSLGVSGSMDVAGVSHFAEKVWMASDLGVSGSLAVHALATFDGGVEISGDKLELTGSFGVKGDSMLDGKLDVSGKATVGSFKSSAAAEFAGDVTVDAGQKLIVSDLNQYSILLGGASHEIAQDAKLTFDGSTFKINASKFTVSTAGAVYADSTLESKDDLKVNNDKFKVSASSGMVEAAGDLKIASDKFVVTASSGDASMAGDLTVSGGKISLSNGSTIDSETAGQLKIDEDLVHVTGDLKVGGNDIKDSADAVALTFKSIHAVGSSVEIAHNMEIKGDNFYAVSGSFSGDLTVDGDLRVKGSMTYIETENLKVKDSLIHISEGGSASAAKGIVLHNGAPGKNDFALGVKPNGSDFVFASGVDDTDSNEGNADVFGGAALAAAWMSEMKIADHEGGAAAGSLAYNGGDIKLASTQDLNLEAADDMMLKSNGNSVGLMEAADYSNVFAAGKWAAGGTIVGALETLHSLATAGTRKGTLSSADVSARVLNFSSIGTIAAEHKYIDVYLNGVLLAPGYDLDGASAIESGTSVKLSADIANALIADDVITVVLRAAA
jgi:hypothetical protein